MGNKAVFLDRDGTIAPDVHYCSRAEDFNLFSFTAKAIRMLNNHGFKVIIITNQSGIARGYFTEEILATIHEKMIRELTQKGATLDGVYYCPHHPDEHCVCRKPNTDLVRRAVLDHDIEIEQSFVIGDSPVDIGMGKRVGCKTILLWNASSPIELKTINSDFIVPNLLAAVFTILRISLASDSQ